MNRGVSARTIAFLVMFAVVCLALSLVVQLGEAIRYDSGRLSPGSQTYAWSELALLLGAPSAALISLALACILSRRLLLIALALPLGALSIYHVYLTLTRL